MSRMFACLIAIAIATGCHGSKAPELRVLGVHDTKRHEVVFVEVTNSATHPMHLTKLEYTFAADGTTLSEGAVDLQREVEAGAAVVLEVPLDAESSRPMTLRGRLTAELDEIVRIFQVDAQIQPH
ncbi:MAG: hypothetical protein JWO36_1137 [Myxococcales bacterium]|nr:hypothetical protein [Myxococcales bacterium]